MARVPERWQFFFCDEKTMVTWYRMLYDYAMIRHVCYESAAFSAANLPYAYPTVKRKCWQPYVTFSGSRHMCTKRNHASLRNSCVCRIDVFFGSTVERSCMSCVMFIRDGPLAPWTPRVAK